MYVRVSKRVRARDQISMNRSMVGIPYIGARNPHCPEYPLIHEILVRIPSSGDSVQWGFRPVVISGGIALPRESSARLSQGIAILN